MMRKLLTAHKASRIRSTLPSQVAPTSPMFWKTDSGVMVMSSSPDRRM